MQNENIASVQDIEVSSLQADDLSVLIGETAGKIWNYLSENKEATSIELKSRILVSNRILYSAIGWLMRENKVIVTPLDRALQIKLK
jgi:hypothetical protein